MAIVERVATFYIRSDGTYTKETVGGSHFYPQDNYSNRLYACFEDGVGLDSMVQVNFRIKNRNITHWLRMAYVDTVTKIIDDVEIVFARFQMSVPNQVLSQGNVSSTTTIDLSWRLVYGEAWLGFYETLGELDTAYPPTEALSLSLDTAYVIESPDTGYHQVELVDEVYTWVNQGQVAEQPLQIKSYGLAQITLQAGQANPNGTVTISTTATDALMTDLTALEVRVGLLEISIGDWENAHTLLAGRVTAVEEDIADIIDGDIIAKKAEQDASGNVITTTYETIINVAFKEDKSNKVTAFQVTPDDTHYPSEKLVKDQLDLKEDKANKATDFAVVNDTKYPTVKAVKDQLDLKLDNTYEDNKEDKSNKATDFTTINDTLYPSVEAVSEQLALKVSKTFTILGIDLQDNILLSEFKTALGNATTILDGLMSSADKVHLDNLVALLATDDAGSVVDTIGEILAIFSAYPEGADLVTALNGKVDKETGKGLSANDLTDILKGYYDTAYSHSQITNGANPHNTTFANIASKPTTISGYGITDAYIKTQVYTQAEIDALLDDLQSAKGLQNTLLTPTDLVDEDTITTADMVTDKTMVIFTATNTDTGEIDSDIVNVSSIVTGAKFIFFDNEDISFVIGATDSTFSAVGNYALKINALGIMENIYASDSVLTHDLTFVTNGDFKADLETISRDQLLYVIFPTTASTSTLRVSTDNGTTYYNVIKNGAIMPAYVVSGQLVRLQFDGTQFIADIQNDVEIAETYANKIDSTYGIFNPQDKGLPIIKEIQGNMLYAPQLVTNGDFSDGTTGWTTANQTASIVGGRLVSSANTTASKGLLNSVTLPIAKYYYNVGYVKLSAISTTNHRILHGGTTIFYFQLNTDVQSFSAVYESTAVAQSQLIWYPQTIDDTITIDNYYIFNISTLIANKQYSNYYEKTFDLLTNAQIKTQMDAWVLDGTLPSSVLQAVENTQIQSVGKNLINYSDLVGANNTVVSDTDSVITISDDTITADITNTNEGVGLLELSIKPAVYVLSYGSNTNGAKAYIKLYDGSMNELPSTYTITGWTSSSSNRYYKDTSTSNALDLSAIPVSYISIVFANVNNTSNITITNLQLELGSVATTYAPYNSETQLFTHDSLYRLPNSTYDSVEYLNGAYYYVQRVKKYTLQASDISAGSTVPTNFDIFVLSLTNMTGIYTASWDNTFKGTVLIDGYVEQTYNDVLSSVNTYYTNNTPSIRFCFPNGTSLATAQSALAGTVIYYQLATPIYTLIDVDGTLIQESVTTLQQIQSSLPATYEIEFSMNTDQTTKTLVERDRIQQEEIDSLEANTVTLLARKTTTNDIIIMSATAWSTYTQVTGEVYGVYDEATFVITFYYGQEA